MADDALINMGAINQALAPIKLDTAGLAQLGFAPVATEKTSRLYRAGDLPAMRAALVAHLAQPASRAEGLTFLARLADRLDKAPRAYRLPALVGAAALATSTQ